MSCVPLVPPPAALVLLKPVYSVPESADVLSVSARTIRRMLADGRLVPLRVGRRVLVTAKSLLAFIEAGS